METKILVCLLLVGTATAAPWWWSKSKSNSKDDDDSPIRQCAQQCNRNPQKFNYQPGQTYVYEYEAETETAIAGASEETAHMLIQVRAWIEVTDRCEHTLRLDNVRVAHSQPGSQELKKSDRQEDYSRELKAQPLRYSFDDGIIRDICHSSSEKIWVLNFKRGILSALQNSLDNFPVREMTKIREVDVSGDCEAEYNEKQKGWWYTTIKVTKTKNLLSCLNRGNIKTVIPMVPYQTYSAIQSVPVINSTHGCEQEVENDIVVKSVCKESHVFAPFSNKQSGARTDVKQSLSWESVRSSMQDDNMPVEVDRRSNLLYQHMNGNEEVKNSLDLAEKKLQEICDQTFEEIKPNTPRLFTELVKIVKQLKTLEVDHVYDSIKEQRICRQNNKGMKFFLDSLPVAGSTGAISVMVDVINRNEVSDVEKQIWLTSLSLIKEPSEDMIPSLARLLNGGSANQALLPVSIVLHTICQKYDCDHSSAFDEIEAVINSNIDSYCSGGDRSKIMKTLRAIGNIGHGRNFVSTLTECLQSSSSPLEVKVNAADAFRRFPCESDEDSRSLFSKFESAEVDGELRIVSFQSLMRCPSEKVLDRIAAQLRREQDDNVGTFVYTYMKNLMETSDPHKQDVRDAVRRLDLKAFEGGWKASRNLEASALWNQVNLGYVADGDLIFSKQSPVPRSVRVNLTVELFGNSINLFEAGARADNLEQFVEKYFGKNGYLPTTDKTQNDVEAFIYARMFGNDMFFKSIQGMEELRNLPGKINFETILEKISKEYDYKYSHTQQLFDETFIFPTMIGMPLNLTLNSTVSVSAEAKGYIQVSGLFSSVMPIDLSADLTASAGFELTGTMMIDAIIIKQGIRMRNTLHADVGLKANMLVKDRQLVSLEVESPKEKQEIFNARSQFFVIHGNVESEQKMIQDNRNQIQRCTGEKVGKITGLQLCGEIQYPNASMIDDAPYFPFTGPASASVVLKKVDTQRSYKLLAKWIKNAKKIQGQFQLDTPGSQVDRHISVDMTVGRHKNPHVDFVLSSPWKKLVVNGRASKTEELATLTGKVVVDDDKLYKLTSEVKLEREEKGWQLIPSVEIDYKGKHVSILTGNVWYERWKEIEARLDLKNVFKQPVFIDGLIVNRDDEKSFEAAIGFSDRKEYITRVSSIIASEKTKMKTTLKSFDAKILLQAPKQKVIDFVVSSDYQLKPLNVKAKVSVDSSRIKKPLSAQIDLKQKGNSKFYPVKVSVTSPVINARLRGNIQEKNINLYSANLKGNYKTTTKKDWMQIFLQLKNNTAINGVEYIMNSRVQFKKYRQYNSKSMLEVTSKQKMMAELNIQYGKNFKDKKKQVEVLAEYNDGTNSSAPNNGLKTDALFKAIVPEKGIDVLVELDHLQNPKEIDSGIKLRLSPLLKNNISVSVIMTNKSNDLHHHVAEVKVEAGGKEYQLKSEMLQKSSLSLDHVVTVSHEKHRHTVVSKYRIDDKQYHVQSTVESTLIKNTVTIKASCRVKNVSDFHLKGSVSEKGREKYAVNVVSMVKQGGELSGDWKVRLSHPERTVKAIAQIIRRNDVVSGSASLNWDVDSKDSPSPKIDVFGELRQKSKRSTVQIKISTPFKNFESLNTDIYIKQARNEIKSSGKIIWGKDQKEISIELTSQYPLSMRDTKLAYRVKTPFKHFKNIELEIDHSMREPMKTQLQGKIGKHEATLVVHDKKGNPKNDRIKIKNTKSYIRRFEVRYDYNSKTIVDVLAFGLNDKLQKFILMTASTPNFRIEKLSAGFNIDIRKGLVSGTHLDMETQNPNQKYNFVTELDASKDREFVKSRIEMQMPNVKQFKMNYFQHKVDETRYKDLTWVMDADDSKLIDFSASSTTNPTSISTKTSAEGKMMYLFVKALSALPFCPKFDTDGKGNKIVQLITKFDLNSDDKTQYIGVDLTADYRVSISGPSITFSKTGDSIDDIRIFVVISNRHIAIEALIDLKTSHHFHFKALLNDTQNPGSPQKHGIVFSKTKKNDNSLLKGKVYLHKLHNFESGFDLLLSSIEHVELTVITTSLVRGLVWNKLTYTHNFQNNSIKCSVIFQDIGGVIASVEASGQTSPSRKFFVKVLTPINGFTKLVISGSYDRQQVEALLKLNDNKPFKLSGTHDNFQNPKLKLTTPYRQLKQITVNIDGPLSDVNVEFQLYFYYDGMMAGNISINYVRPTQMGAKMVMISRLDGNVNKMRLNIGYRDEPSHSSHLLVSLNGRDKIKYNFNQSSDSNNSKNQLDFEVLFPSLAQNANHIVLSLNGDQKKTTGSLKVLDELGKAFDADIVVNMKKDKSASLTVRQPKYMEYKISQKNFKTTQQNKISYNWDQNDPEANAEFQVVIKDDSDSYKLDKMVRLAFTCPLRSVGVQHSIYASTSSIKSAGKVFWNKGDNDQVSYEIEVRDDSTKYDRNAAYSGHLNVRLPTRTVGVSGFARDEDNQKAVETVFSWDLDKDITKKVGVRTTIAKGDHLQADVSVILPKDAHVDSKLVMNKGNTIVEGQTQIVYSNDPSKTLTLFSKLVNQPGSRSFFYQTQNRQNYSLQFGMSHPDSRIEVKMMSHIGMDEDSLTTSLGFDYLTSRRQVKNMDLFLEINKLKKEVNFYANNPYRSVAITGSMKSQDPLEMSLSSTINGQENMATSLKVNPDRKSVQIEWSTEEKTLSYQASVPNQKSLQFVRDVYQNGRHEQDFKIAVSLPSPHILETNIHWKPGMLVRIRDIVNQRMRERKASFNELIDEVSPDVEREITAKYEDVVQSVVQDVQDIVVSIQNELDLIEQDIQMVEQKLSEDVDVCDIQIGDHSVKKDITVVKNKVSTKVNSLTDKIKTHSASYKKNLHSLYNHLEKVKRRRPREFYQQVKRQITSRGVKSEIFNFIELLRELSLQEVNKFWDWIEREIDHKNFDPNPILDAVYKDIQTAMNSSVSSVMNKTLQANLLMANKLLAKIDQIKEDLINHNVNKAIMDALEQSDSEIYHILRWSASYLKMSHPLSQSYEDVLIWIFDVVEQEVKHYINDIIRLVRNPITKFDQHQGVLQAQVPLLVPVHRLDQLPRIPQITAIRFPQDLVLQTQPDAPNQTNEEPTSQWDNVWAPHTSNSDVSSRHRRAIFEPHSDPRCLSWRWENVNSGDLYNPWENVNSGDLYNPWENVNSGDLYNPW